MTLPTHPAAYWRPEVSLSDVWYLRRTGEWSFFGKLIAPSEVPAGLTLLGEYKPERDA